MDGQGTVFEKKATDVLGKPFESEQAFDRRQPKTPFEQPHRDCCSNMSHSLTATGQEKQPHSKPPPTAMVAPLVGTVSSSRSHSTTSILSPSVSPRMSRKGLDRTTFGGIEGVLSSPSLDRVHEKASLRAGESLSSSKQIHSLKNSLNERSQIIERQKLTISRLQQECREKDSQLRKLHLLSNATTATNEVASTTLLLDSPTIDQTTLSSTAVSAPVKIDMLTRKLDSLYYELEKNKEELHTTLTQLTQQKEKSSDLEKQLDKSHSRTKELEQKIENLQGYLGNMPTMEEHYGLKDEVRSLKEQRDHLQQQMKSIEQLAEELKATIRRKEEELNRKTLENSDMHKKNNELEAKLHGLESRVLELHSENTRLKSRNLELQEDARKFDQKLNRELNAMRDRHHSRFRDATAKLRDQHKEVVRRNKLLEKQLLKSSDAMSELSTELSHKQGMVGELKSSLTALVGENQGLLQQNLALQASHAEVVRSRQSSPADNGLLQRLMQETTLCVDDFQSLVSLASSIIDGQDPCSSILLGVKPVGESSASPFHTGAVTTEDNIMDSILQKHLDQIQKLRGEIERLRSVVTERYADQIANDCTVQ